MSVLAVGDSVVLPRPRLAGLEVERATVIATVTVDGRPVHVPVAVSPSLAAAVGATLVPAVAER
jgi:hypothetical protein